MCLEFYIFSSGTLFLFYKQGLQGWQMLTICLRSRVTSVCWGGRDKQDSTTPQSPTYRAQLRAGVLVRLVPSDKVKIQLGEKLLELCNLQKNQIIKRPLLIEGNFGSNFQEMAACPAVLPFAIAGVILSPKCCFSR